MRRSIPLVRLGVVLIAVLVVWSAAVSGIAVTAPDRPAEGAAGEQASVSPVEQPQMDGLTEAQRQALTEGMEEDAEAFNAVMAAYKLPKGTEKEQAKRHAATQRAMTHAAEVPLETAREVLRAMEIALTMTQKGNPNAVTDAASAVWLGMAALQAAALNVRINATSIDDQERARGWLDELDGLLTRADAILAQAQATAVERGGL